MNRMLHLEGCDENERMRVSLLGQDEGDAGAVGPQRRRRSPLPGAAVEHGRCGQRRRDAAVPRHVPQLVRVPVNGVVVVQLDPGTRRASHT